MRRNQAKWWRPGSNDRRGGGERSCIPRASRTMATTSPGVLLFDVAAIRATLASYDGWWSGGLVIVELRRLATGEDLQAIAHGMLRGPAPAAIWRYYSREDAIQLSGASEVECLVAQVDPHARVRAELLAGSATPRE